MAVNVQLNSGARVLFLESELRRLQDLRDTHPQRGEERTRLDAEIKLAELTLSHCRAAVEVERSVGQIESSSDVVQRINALRESSND